MTGMTNFRGLLYVKHGRVGTRSEGPDYYLQTWRGDLLVRDAERFPWQPDYRLEFFARRMVEIDGILEGDATIRVERIAELQTTTLPHPRGGEGCIGVPLDLRVGQRLQIVDEPVALLFEAVVAESRSWTGHANAPAGGCTLRMALVPADGAATTFSLTVDAGAPELAVAQVLGYHVTLHGVSPQPTADEPQPPTDRYVATVLLGRLE
jgi:hypothetical protein